MFKPAVPVPFPATRIIDDGREAKMTFVPRETSQLGYKINFLTDGAKVTSLWPPEKVITYIDEHLGKEAEVEITRDKAGYEISFRRDGDGAPSTVDKVIFLAVLLKNVTFEEKPAVTTR